MSDALLPALSLAAAVLSCVIVVELATGGSTVVARRSVTAASTQAGAAKPPDPIPQQVATLLARPLFSPDRKPDIVDGADDPRLPHLTGILVTSRDRKAIFAGRDGARGAVVGPGEQIGAYRVEAISATDVTLAGADGSHLVRPSFSAAAATAPIAAPPLFLSTPQIPPPPIASLGTPAGILQNPSAPAIRGAGSPQ